MTATKLSIGDFSRMTYLSVKALRHYHDIGVLEPVEVDADSGYRFYAPNQVGMAQMIRRLRDLGMPLDDVRTIVTAADPASRDEALVTHLRRMEQQLEETQQTVASLRSLLEQPKPSSDVHRRHIDATTALVISDFVRGEDAVAWWMEAFGLLHQTLRGAEFHRVGPDGALFPAEFFENEAGEVVAFVPFTGDPQAPLHARVKVETIPAATVAVLVHDGPFGDLDRTYGALGSWVLEQAETAAEGPIREYYLPTGDPDDLLAHRTEVCWPIAFRAAG
jgi:DNA-binding transcriptional MerR regulator